MGVPPIREFGRWQPGQRRQRLHQHRNAGLELVHVAKGHLRWAVEERVEAVPPGSLFFTLPWQRHGGTTPIEPGAAISWLILPLVGPRQAWRFAPALGIQAEEQRLAELRVRFATGRHCHPASPLCAELMDRCVNLLEGGDADRMLLSGLLTALIAAAAACIDAPQPTDEAAVSRRRVRSWIAMIRDRPEDDRDLSASAAACGLARSRFAALVLEETGDSPVRYRNRMRVSLACRMLEASDRPVTAIALDCGFGSSQYFARQFRSFTGLDPSSWRDHHRR